MAERRSQCSASRERELAGYLAAAERGDAHAFFALGLIYATGRLVEADPVVAHMWFNLAAREGVRAAAEERRLLAQEMTPGEIARAQRLAREWLEAHAPVASAAAQAAAVVRAA